MTKFLFLSALFTLTSTLVLGLSEDGNSRVAVIGAGVGGASAAYYLRQELGNSTRIDV